MMDDPIDILEATGDTIVLDLPTLIFCGGNNPRFAEIAVAHGFRYGCELTGDTPYAPVYFADQDWRAYKRAKRRGPEAALAFRSRYMARLATHRPPLATVVDWERMEQLQEVLDWAEEAAQYVKQVLIIPKVCAWENPIRLLPERIGSADIVLAYSVPTRYGGTDVPIYQFEGWPIHILGGSPHEQMCLTRKFNAIARVVSVDGNMAQAQANECRLWRQRKGKKGHWVQLAEEGAGDFGQDSNYEAFRRSCLNIMNAWRAMFKAPETE